MYCLVTNTMITLVSFDLNSMNTICCNSSRRMNSNWNRKKTFFSLTMIWVIVLNLKVLNSSQLKTRPCLRPLFYWWKNKRWKNEVWTTIFKKKNSEQLKTLEEKKINKLRTLIHSFTLKINSDWRGRKAEPIKCRVFRFIRYIIVWIIYTCGRL